MAVHTGLVTTLREPRDKILRFVNYHLNVGIDHILLFLDEGEPPPALLGDPRVTVTRCDPEHWRQARRQLEEGPLRALRDCDGRRYRAALRQLGGASLDHQVKQYLNASLALGRARSLGLDWLFHVDGDELIHVREGRLGAEMAGVPDGVDWVVFSTLEAVPHAAVQGDGFTEVGVFRDVSRPTWASSPPLDRLLARACGAAHASLAWLAGCRETFFRGAYFRGHAYGKSAARTRSPIVGLHLHRPVARGPLRVRRSRRGRILHFDCITYEGWVAKWAGRYEGDRARPHRRRAARAAQGEAFIRPYADGSEAALRALYARLYFVPERQRGRLFALGLLRRISLPPELFLPGPRPGPTGG